MNVNNVINKINQFLMVGGCVNEKTFIDIMLVQIIFIKTAQDHEIEIKKHFKRWFSMTE